jgi:hypothetical protein
MILIHACELNGGNPFDYVTELRGSPLRLPRNMMNSA